MKKIVTIGIILYILMSGCKDSEICDCNNSKNNNYWEKLDGLAYLGIYPLFITKNDYLFTACSNDIIFRSIDGGGKWDAIIYWKFPEYFVEDNNKTIYTSADNYGGTGRKIYYSNDNGTVWDSIEPPNQNVMGLYIDKKDNFYYSLGSRMLISRDYCKTWQPYGPDSFGLKQIYFNSMNMNFVVSSKGIACSTDDGNTWKVQFPKANYSDFYMFLFNSKDHIFIGTDSGNFRSTDYGETWEKLISLPTGQIIYNMVVDKNDILYALVSYGKGGFVRGVLTSSDNGYSWQSISSGLKFTPYCLAIDSKGYLFLGSYGIYKSKKSVYK
jgi:hypothetical protein